VTALIFADYSVNKDFIQQIVVFSAFLQGINWRLIDRRSFYAELYGQKLFFPVPSVCIMELTGRYLTLEKAQLTLDKAERSASWANM
jgi:hypothetical protein